MSSPISKVSNDVRRAEVCLGLALGTREVGIAIATREDLLCRMVANIRKIPSPEGKERRFAQLLDHLVARHRVSRLAYLEPIAPLKHHPVVATEVLTLQALGRREGIPVTVYEVDRVKAALLPGSPERVTNRMLTGELVRMFPELQAQSAKKKERYWSRMFLALAASLHDLNEALKTRFSTPV